jgi:tRNA(adenine34) deaminase
MEAIDKDIFFMQAALKEAKIAMEKDEVPVGAVVVYQNQIIARAHNQTESLNDVTAHAEMLAITMASDYIGGKFLNECTLYVTLEPCVMCAGACYWGRFKRIVVGAKDEKRGFKSKGDDLLHPTTEYMDGVLEEECSKILKDFFKLKRL